MNIKVLYDFNFLPVTKDERMKFILLALILVSTLSHASVDVLGLNITEKTLVSKLKSYINEWDKTDAEKKELMNFEFKDSPYSEYGRITQISNVLISISDVNRDGVVDEVDMVYPAPRGGMTSENLGVRSAVLETVIGEKLASSREADFVKSTTGTRNEGKRGVVVGKFGLASTLLEDGVNQMLVIKRIDDIGKF